MRRPQRVGGRVSSQQQRTYLSFEAGHVDCVTANVRGKARRGTQTLAKRAIFMLNGDVNLELRMGDCRRAFHPQHLCPCEYSEDSSHV